MPLASSTLLPPNAFHDLNVAGIGRRMWIEHIRMFRPFWERPLLLLIILALTAGLSVAQQGPLWRLIASSSSPVLPVGLTLLGVAAALSLGYVLSFFTLAYSRTTLTAFRGYRRLPKAMLLLVHFIGICFTMMLVAAIFDAAKPHIESSLVASFYVGLVIGVHALLDCWIIFAALLCLRDVLVAILATEHAVRAPAFATSASIRCQKPLKTRLRTTACSGILLLPQALCLWVWPAADLEIRVSLLLGAIWLCHALGFGHVLSRRWTQLNRSLLKLLATLRVMDGIASLLHAWRGGSRAKDQKEDEETKHETDAT